jgi:hypothetical protein
MQRGFFRVPAAGSLADTDHLSQDNRRPCKRASKTTRSDDRSRVCVGTPLLVTLSPEQEREAVALLGQLLLDATPTGVPGVSTGALDGAFPSAFDGATSPRTTREKAHRNARSGR